MDRALIRNAMRAQRQQLSDPIYQTASLKICQFIVNRPWFQNSQHIACYQAVRGELDTHLLMEQAWKMGKICHLPICDPALQKLNFVPYYPEDPLFRNRYGILEPSAETHPATEPTALDIAFLPLLAFDAHGNRLGSGKCYYDRTFAYLHDQPKQIKQPEKQPMQTMQPMQAKQSKQLRQPGHKPQLVGLAYAFQEVENLETQPWDIPLDKIIVFDTERQGVLEISPHR